jgi:hypothetical protein
VDGVSPIPRWTLEGVMADSYICPRKQIEGENVGPWLDLYSHYAAGHLYEAGGVSDQPAIYMQVMRLIQGAVKDSANV